MVDKKIEAQALLATGEKPKDVAEKTGIGYQTVLGMKRKLEAENSGMKDIEVLTQVDLPTLHTIAEAVKEKAPANVVKKIDKLVEGVTSLQSLEPKFHAVVVNLLEAAEELSLKDDLSVRDWAALSSGIGSLYSSVFNKSGISVNVNNQTQINGEKMSMFRGSMRGS